MLSPLSLAKFSREELSTAVWDLYKMENWKRLKLLQGGSKRSIKNLLEESGLTMRT